MAEFLKLVLQVAVDTVTYLMAWWAVPLWAVAASVLLQWWGTRLPLKSWVRSESIPRRTAGAFLLAAARPLGRESVRRNLGLLEGRPWGTAIYLTAGHGLTVYYFFLMGPLLGKDVLLSHVVGGIAFAGFAAAGARAIGLAGPSDGAARPSDGESGTPEAQSLREIGRREVVRFGGWAGWGLLVGAVIGAAGLSHPSLLLVELPLGEGLVRQLTHAGLGAAAAVATFIWPVSTLFAGTYLWKVGLAHAGLVAFFYGATVAPQRVRIYRRVWGEAPARKWILALATAAVAAGLVTAVLFGLTGLDIHYKLVPAQLWSP